MRRQFLRDLGSDAIDDFCVKGPAKIAKYFRRRDDDELLETIGMSMAMERFGKLARKPFLCKVMPVDFFHGTSGNARTCDGSSRTIGALLTRWRIVLLENPLNNEIDVQCIAPVAQEKRLLAIANENETTVGNVRPGFRRHSCDAPNSMLQFDPNIWTRRSRRGIGSNPPTSPAAL
jgi:hypothetical protein